MALQQTAPSQPAAQAAQPQLSSGASASQLTAVLNNLTAMRRTGSTPVPAHGSAGGGLPGLPPAHSLPLPGQGGQPPQADLLQQLLLQQQAAGGGMGLDGFGGAAGAAGTAPSHHIQHLSSLLAGQSLGPPGGTVGQAPVRTSTPMLTPQHSGQVLSPQHSATSLPGLGPQLSGMLSPQHSGHLPAVHHHGSAQQSLAATFGQLGAGPQAPPSPAAHGLAGHGAAHAQPGSLPSSLPQHFVCPLSRQVMTDPVSGLVGREARAALQCLGAAPAGLASRTQSEHYLCSRHNPHCSLVWSWQVMAADGVTYERQAITEWLAFK